MLFKSLILNALVCVALAFSVQAVDTIISVRVLAKDAKFIGTSMGGAEVVIRDVNTGEILAKGLTAGGTGNTALIMKTPRERHSRISGASSAHFTATLDLVKPRLIEVSARGPLAPNTSAVVATSQQWVVPGKHVTEGDAWLIELRGLVVEMVDLASEVVEGDITLKAKVRMMCGCPTSPAGLWDSAQMEIVAILERDGAVSEVPLVYTGEISHFTATVPVIKGSYEVTIYAYQAQTGNTGLVATRLDVK